MKIGRHLVITLLILPLIVFFGCSRPNQEVSAAGTIENSIYKNSYFGMEIPFQKSWHILDARMVRALEQYGAKAVAGSNRNDIEQTNSYHNIGYFKTVQNNHGNGNGEQSSKIPK